ncbi:MAG: flagellar biosynthetic protein FliR [Deferrisomatales bacterium]|nr:flagellar biosynthetic protein FliR [Deferrisomatales bacterium]
MDILGISEARLFGFLLVLLRVGALFAFAPVFSTSFVPARVRAAAALGVSACLGALGLPGEIPVPESLSVLLVLGVQEVLVGALAGYVAQLVFAAARFGGQVAGVQMGLGVASVLAPGMEPEVSVVSHVQFVLAALLFLAVGGEGLLLEGFARNLASVPPGQPLVSGSVAGALVHLTGEVFVLGLKLAAPVVAAVFASQVVLGVLARSVPQLNVLLLGFPLQILVGFTVLGLAVGPWGATWLRALSHTFEALEGVFSLLG